MPRPNRKVQQQKLENHYEYQGRFAHNVRLRHLRIPDDVEDAAWQAIEDPFLFGFFQQNFFDQFAERCPGANIQFEGRSNGYLVLHGIAHLEDLAELSARDIAYLTTVVADFDETVEQARLGFIEYCKEHHQ